MLRKKELSRKLKNLISNKKNFSFKKAFFALIATGLIFTSATLAAVKVFKQPSIKWTPEKIEITLFTGTSKSSSASFLSNENLYNSRLELVPELAKFASVEPANISKITAGQNNSVNLLFSIPQATATGTYEGTLHLKSDKKTIPQTLKIVLNVKEPTVDYIPFDEVSLPILGRIYKNQETGATYVKDEVVIRFKDSVSQTRIKEIVSKINGKIMGYISDIEVYQVLVPIASPSEIELIINELENYSEVIIASYHWINQIF